jgi:hypothetical protein
MKGKRQKRPTAKSRPRPVNRGILCPACRGPTLSVQTFPHGDSTERRRQCRFCRLTFKTVERISEPATADSRADALWIVHLARRFKLTLAEVNAAFTVDADGGPTDATQPERR